MPLTPADSSVGLIMVGVGGYGAHRRGLVRQAGGFRLLGAWDRSPAALAQCVQQESCRAATSFADLLDTPGAEALIISTGASAHAEQAIAALERGLHVFVEKPLCTSTEEVAALRAAQQRAGRVIGVGHHDLAADPQTAHLQQLIARGDLGTITAIERTTAHSGGHHIKPGDWRGDPAANPGGMLFQCGVHAIHELVHLFGPIAAVACTQRNDVLPTATADAACVLLRFASGLIGTLNAYHCTPYRHTLAIFGSAGTLYRDDRYFDEGSRLLLQRLDARGGKEPQEIVTVPRPAEVAWSSLRRFHAAIRAGTAMSPDLEAGIRAVLPVFAAERAARSGRWEFVEAAITAETAA